MAKRRIHCGVWPLLACFLAFNVENVSALNDFPEKNVLEQISTSSTTTTTTTAPITTTDLFRQAVTTSRSTCTLSGSGFFGAFNQNPRTINFLYQVNVASGVSAVDIQQDLGPMLNRDVVQGILPQLFPNRCSRRRRNLRDLQSTTTSIVGVSAQQMDLATGVGDLSCASTEGAGCYTVLGNVVAFVENALSSDEDVSEVLEPMVRLYLQGNLRNLDPRIVSVHHVVRSPTANIGGDNNGGITFSTTAPLPTAAPVVPTPTVAPTPIPPVRPGEPTRTPTTARPTLPPFPTQPPNNNPPPIFGTNAPTRSPTNAVPIDPQNSSARGIGQIQWWGWLLTAIGLFVLVIAAYLCLTADNNNSRPVGGGGRVAPKNDRKNDDDNYISGSAYVPPGVDEYNPPGLGAFAETDVGPLSTYPEEADDYDEDEDEDNDDHYDDEDDDEDDDDEDDDGEDGTYDDGEDIDEDEAADQVGEMYGEGGDESYEEETTYEEVTVYEEEGGGGQAANTSSQVWSSEYSVDRSRGGGSY